MYEVKKDLQNDGRKKGVMREGEREAWLEKSRIQGAEKTGTSAPETCEEGANGAKLLQVR